MYQNRKQNNTGEVWRLYILVEYTIYLNSTNYSMVCNKLNPNELLSTPNSCYILVITTILYSNQMIDW